MDVIDFLKKLAKLYDLDKKEDEFQERVLRYSKILRLKEAERKDDIDYEATIDKIVENYPYRIYPNFTEILKNLVYKPKETTQKTKNIFKPKNFRITTSNGKIYVFAEVSENWENVHKISDFKDCKIEQFV